MGGYIIAWLHFTNAGLKALAALLLLFVPNSQKIVIERASFSFTTNFQSNFSENSESFHFELITTGTI